MADNKTLQQAIELIKKAIQEKKTINQVCIEQLDSSRRNYVAKVVYDIDERLKAGIITEEEYNEFLNIWNEYLSVKGTFAQTPGCKSKKPTIPEKKISQKMQKPLDFDHLTEEEKMEVEYDAYDDDNYDDRSSSEIIRDEDEIIIIDEATGTKNKKITGYSYRILIKGEQPLVGELSRDEMDMVYRLYSNLDGAGLTQRAVSRHFRHLTFRDFKRILRAFNITKQSIPVAPHVIEENNEAKVTDIVFRNKENNILKKLEDDRGKQTEKILKETQKELIRLQAEKSNLKAMFEGISLDDIEPLKIKKVSLEGEKRAIVVYLSDQHVGAHTKEDSIYSNKYDEVEFERRMQKTFDKILESYMTFGRFDKIIICNVGDSLDGFDGKTTRGGHDLPQNMDNKKQFDTYVEISMKFFDALHQADITNNIEYQCVGDDNHAGDFGYMANKALCMLLGLKYPDMHVNIFSQFIDSFEYGDHTFIMCHGKDKEDMRNGMPLSLDNKTELFFSDYITNKEIKNKYLHVIVGDLHQSLKQYGKGFRWKRVASMYGASKWIHTNFGNTKAAVDFEIVSKNNSDIFENRVSF